ncbi:MULTISPECIES: ABC transporter ATP-binding protein [Marinobacter]|uniref:ABC transporter ATP-binding protein n=1 Tax=Marinobacter TaxID=2742 RepID=UPI000DAD4D9A|nr:MULTISPECIES: ABC transporter ATP-binding protein [Marinobacter]
MNSTTEAVQPGRTVLSLDGITMKIAGLVALDNVTFSIPAGQIVSLIGPNGAGKTTAFNVISGYMPPTAGSVHLFDADITGHSPHSIASRGLVRSFQRTSVFDDQTVFDNLLTAYHLQGRTSLLQSLLRLTAFRKEEAELRTKVEGMLDFLDLRHRADERAGSLSYGEQRILGVGIALAASPKILLLDEPAAGLNPSETDAFKAMIRRIGDSGVTVLLVEHDMHMVMSISDHIVVLNQGRVIAEGDPQAIQTNPDVIEAYLGSGVKHAQA